MTSVEQYYDNNTSRFLSLGQTSESHNIHRLLWAPNVKTKEDAINYSNSLILSKIPQNSRPNSVLDLGCGVGATLLYIDNHCNSDVQLTGITISNNQILIAKEKIKQKNSSREIKIEKGDFHNLSSYKNQDFIYQIESFVHSDKPAILLQQVAKSLSKGGLYCICDDFLNINKMSGRKEDQLINDFKEGWHIGNLNTTEEVEKMANENGLQLVEKKNLTPYLNIFSIRDRIINIGTSVYKFLPFNSLYWESLKGGDALQRCLKRGVVQYWFLVFSKLDDGI